ncbi:MAG: glycosyl transferase [Cyanobium sp. CACIAM 14]|nr:MAG: glycosyl transferase [Cyanobium sp. CACIAM 14]
MDRVRLLNLDIDNLTMDELLERLDRGVVYTPNVDHLLQLQDDPSFFVAYEDADFRVCDSQLLIFAARVLGTPLRQKLSGSDLFPAFCRFHRNHSNVTIFLLGAREGVAAQAQGRINARIGRQIVVGTYSPPFGFENDQGECEHILQQVERSGATVLAVGLGAPKQERFIHRFRSRLSSVRIFLAIGATIDFEAGTLSRSPGLLSSLGLEWFYRLCREPRRLWRRYLWKGPRFFWLLLLQRLGLYRDPWKRQLRAAVEPED